MTKIKGYCINLLLVLGSLIILLLLLEFIVFRFILIASDMPEIGFSNGIVKYVPNQTGIYRMKNEIKASYKINADGWNSGYDHYDINKSENLYRIAIVGDSYVEATEVDFNKSLAERLEQKLGEEHFQVYRFGISGAPMSQYLHMLRKEVSQYRPDLVVVLLVHNDFDESYKLLHGSYESNFMKLKIENSTISEVQPGQFQSPWYTPIRDSAIWRYLALRQKMPYRRIKNILLGNEQVYQANISIDSLKKDRIKNDLATRYIFKAMKKYCDSIDAELVYMINGVMGVVYGRVEKDESIEKGALSFNLLANEAARENNIDFIDLQPFFEKDYAIHKKRFDFISDGHWNERGHEIVADVMYIFIKHKYRK